MLDSQDRAILRRMQADPALTAGEVAELTGLSAAQVTRRLDRMQRDGMIRGQSAVIDWAAMGYPLRVSLRVSLDKTVPGAFDAFVVAARDVAEVLEIQTFLGRVDVRLSLVARDLAHYQAVYRDRILALPHIADIEALMDVAAVKSETGLPL
ncbi:Lrp/AsnC family transcriptional regulator [Loktanella sp. DSM 29012]|uniref:Lrp/AsnC family transcriptional regulator n=1 Tax=Loktanella sp. DSM 29012 TaxID=1881056 RepID=UPI0008CAA473|nr:Lrp/AsnC family transcriptional regulator [Loktanella sp. DSM 29012]SEQ56858.1 Lrp/AsnC family transcriptional regulator [Loktanella sp. DSM 29012]